MTLIDLLKAGQDELEENRLEDAELSFSRALELSASDDDRQEVLRCLLKLAGKYLRLGAQNRPGVLFDYLAGTDLQERTRVLEWLARLHQQMEDLAGAERIYLDIFEQRARSLGCEHADSLGALQTAALLLQMQGKSAEELYVRAYQISRERKAAEAGLTEKGTVASGSEPVADLSFSRETGLNLSGEDPATGSGQDYELDETAEEIVSALMTPVRSEALPEKNECSEKTGGGLNTLFMLDALLSQEKPQEEEPPEQRHVDGIPQILEGPLTISANIRELLDAWEIFCNQITLKLGELSQQQERRYRTTLELLSGLAVSRGVKPVDLEHPFLFTARNRESRLLDWKILHELSPLLSAGSLNSDLSATCAIYSCLRRAFELGPLHVDSLQSLYRVAQIYASPGLRCRDLEFAAEALFICLLAYREHPEVNELLLFRCCIDLSAVLREKNSLRQSREVLMEAARIADSCNLVERAQLRDILGTIAQLSEDLGDYETAAGAYERLRSFQEAVSRNAELFETFIRLIRVYRLAENEPQMQSYQQRLLWELDWLEDANPMREKIACKARDLGQSELAELMLHDILLNSNPYEPIAGRAVLLLIDLYEASGRTDMARRLRSRLGG